MTTFVTTWTSPVGPLTLVKNDLGLAGVFFEDHRHAPAIDSAARRDERPFAEEIRQLAAYFAGERTTFELPLAPRGTSFQRAVWSALRAIPYGTTTTYAAIAATVGRPRASRAVGAANGRNPLSIVVPCHRVVGASGALVGYAGGEDRKRFLLELERRAQKSTTSPSVATTISRENPLARASASIASSGSSPV